MLEGYSTHGGYKRWGLRQKQRAAQKGMGKTHGMQVTGAACCHNTATGDRQRWPLPGLLVLALACICLPWFLLSPCAHSALVLGQGESGPGPQSSSRSSARDLTAPLCQRELNYEFTTRARATMCTQMPLPEHGRPLPTSASLGSGCGGAKPPKAGPLPPKSSAALSSSHLSYVLPEASRALCSVISNSLFHVSPGCLMSWKHLPVPSARSDTEEQSKNKEGIPTQSTDLGTVFFNKPVRGVQGWGSACPSQYPQHRSASTCLPVP